MEIDISKSDFNKTIAPWLGKTSKMMNAYIYDIFQHHNISISKQQWIVLKILSENPDGIIQNELAFITDRNKATLTRLINGMENNKLVTRLRSKKDSRKNIVILTEKGSNLFTETKPVLLESILKIQENISETEMNSFIKIMSKIQHQIKHQSNLVQQLNNN